MSMFIQDVRHSVRTLSKSPGFSAVALITLALGIGANTAIFSLLDTVYLRPLPYTAPGRLAKLAEKHKSGDTGLSYKNYWEWVAQSSLFENIAVRSAAPVTRMAASGAETVAMFCVSGNFFETLGVKPQLGRLLIPSDDTATAPLATVLTHRYWMSGFGSDPGVIGRRVALNGKSYTIAGVLPAWFHFDPAADLYVPIYSARELLFLDMPENHNLYGLAKMKPGVSIRQAQAELDVIARRLVAQSKEKDPAGGAAVKPLRKDISGEMQDRYFILLGAVALVLLIACVNVANLMLARAAARRKEMAVRAALGASRWRIVRQLLTESVVLAVTASVLGIGLAWWTLEGLAVLLPFRFLPEDLTMNGTVLLFTVLVAAITGILFGLVPALQEARVSLSEALKDVPGLVGSGRSRLRKGLAVAEVAMATVLLIGAGLLVGSFWRVLRTDPGFRSEHTVSMRIDWPSSDPLSFIRIWPFYREVIQQVEALPGVAATAGGPAPLTGAAHLSPVNLDERPGRPAQASFQVVTPSYFAMMGIPLRKGRLLTEADAGWPDAKSRDELIQRFMKMHYVTVINEAMARAVWPGEDPIGKRFRWYGPQGPITEVVGVVSDAHLFQRDREPEPTYFVSEGQYPLPLTLLVRSRMDPGTLVKAVKAIVKQAEPAAPVMDIKTLDQIAAESLAPRRVNLLLIGSFATLALVLAFIGVYGVVSYSVARRTHEIGIRIALGASKRRLVGGLVAESALLGVVGVLAGCAAALPLARLLSSMLFGISSRDPLTYGTASAVLLVASALAGYLPARRATLLDPVSALKSE